LSGSPLGSPVTTALMLDFCERHGIAPVTELSPLSKANEALAHLAAGKARQGLRTTFSGLTHHFFLRF